MLQSHYSAASYFRTIDGFIYPRQPLISHPVNTVVPVASRDPHMLMPLHRRVVGLSGLSGETLHNPKDVFTPGTWVSPAKGLYRGDSGVIMPTDYEAGFEIDASRECLVGFLPRFALTKQPSKKLKLVHSEPSLASTSSVNAPVATTLLSGWKAKSDYVSANTAAGFPVPAERVGILKQKHPPAPRLPKIYRGSASIESFARSHSISISKLKCYQCVSPQKCDHSARRYTILGQDISHEGIALVILKFADLQEARAIPSRDLLEWLGNLPGIINTRLPLPSSWFFDYGERVRLSVHYACGKQDADVDSEIAAGAEGQIEAVHPTGCDVSFIDQARAAGCEQVVTATENIVRFIPYRFLLKVMNPGDLVEIRQPSSPPLEGLVVGAEHIVTVRLDLRDNEIQTYHPNCLKNLSLLPKIHLAHGLLLPRNVNTTPITQSSHPAEVPNTFTGRAPWVGTEIKVIGVEHGETVQMHKGEVGQVLDVSVNTSMTSGLAILVRFDAPSTSPDKWIDFDRIRRRDNSCFLAYSMDARSHFQFQTGYKPTHSNAEIYLFYGNPRSILEPENKQLAEERNSWEARESAEIVERERLAIQNHNNSLENASFTQGGAPLVLRTGTPPPSTDWFNNPEITSALPRGKVMVALRGQDIDVEVTIALKDGCNEATYYIKPKAQQPKAVAITAQHLDPEKCSHVAFNSYSPKLFLVCRGDHVGKLGRAVGWGVADEIILKPVRHEQLDSSKKYKVRRFREVLLDGPVLRASQYHCAHVPMMPDEEVAAKKALPLVELRRVIEKQVLGMRITDAEKALLGE